MAAKIGVSAGGGVLGLDFPIQFAARCTLDVSVTLNRIAGIDCLEGAMITVCGVYQPARDCPIIVAASRTNSILEHWLNNHILGGGFQPIEDKDQAAVRGRI